MNTDTAGTSVVVSSGVLQYDRTHREVPPGARLWLPLRDSCVKTRRINGVTMQRPRSHPEELYAEGMMRFIPMRQCMNPLTIPYVPVGKEDKGLLCMPKTAYMRSNDRALGTTVSVPDMLTAINASRPGGRSKVWCQADATIEHVAESIVDSWSSITPPLCMYSGDAYEEQKSMPGVSAWPSVYEEVAPIQSHTGLYGTIHDNQVFAVGVPDSEADCPDAQLRHRLADHAGFVDCLYTQTSIDAMKLRSLTHGCSIRVTCDETIDQAISTVAALHEQRPLDEPKTWNVYWQGLVMPICKPTPRLITHLMQSSGREGCSVYYLSRLQLVVISTCSSVVMRPSSIDPITLQPSGPWYDSLMARCMKSRGGVGRGSQIQVPTRMDRSEMNMYMGTYDLLVPYIELDQPLRPQLGRNMSIQALTVPSVRSSEYTQPLNTSWPIVMTPGMTGLRSMCAIGDPCPVPGRNLVVLFHNMNSNFEDSVVMNKRVHDSGTFNYRSVIQHGTPNNVSLTVGTRVGHDDQWWRPAVSGTVAYTFSAGFGNGVGVETDEQPLHVGDKLATQHGQKIVISSIPPDDQMPQCYDQEARHTFTPDIVVSCTGVLHRLETANI